MDSLSEACPPPSSAPRTQRLKATCNECARRKIKCCKSLEAVCQYCTRNGFKCVYAPIFTRVSKRKQAKAKALRSENAGAQELTVPTVPEERPVTWPSPVSLSDYVDDEQDVPRPSVRRCYSDPTGRSTREVDEMNQWWDRQNTSLDFTNPSTSLWHLSNNLIPDIDILGYHTMPAEWVDQSQLYKEATAEIQQQDSAYNSPQLEASPKNSADDTNHLLHYTFPQVSPPHYSASNSGSSPLPESCMHHIYEVLQSLGTAPNGHLASPASASSAYSIDDILSRTDDAIAHVSSVLECPCSARQSVLFPLSLIVYEVIAWYEAVTWRVRELADVSLKPCRQRLPVVKIGHYEVERQSAAQIIERFILGRIARVRVMLAIFEQVSMPVADAAKQVPERWNWDVGS